MKKLITLILFVLILLTVTAMAKQRKIIVKKVGENLYKSETGFYIETIDCLEEVVENKAVLKYKKNSDNNKIIFENGSSCTVVIIFKL